MGPSNPERHRLSSLRVRNARVRDYSDADQGKGA
jgi:hypothetical protein